MAAKHFFKFYINKKPKLTKRETMSIRDFTTTCIPGYFMIPDAAG